MVKKKIETLKSGKTLIITEKPSVARDIARTLGDFQKSDKHFLESPEYIITWAYGHLLELASPEKYDPSYKFWTIKALPIIPEKFELQPIEKSSDQLKKIISLIKDSEIETLINACDAGREGELIFRNIYEFSKTKKKHYRLWLSSMVATAINNAFKDLKDGDNYEKLGKAAKCRSHADWLIGINSTRALTRRCGDLFSIGRVQTPTLSILVEREKEIINFISRKYYEIKSTFLSDKIEYEGKWTDLKSKKENPDEIETKKQADEIYKKIDGKEGLIEKVKSRESYEKHPLLYDLTELQRDANKRFGFTASRTLSIAQSLYEQKKIITYPRTDSRYLPADIISELPDILKTLQSIDDYSEYSVKALKNKKNLTSRVINDAKVTDHFAIIPTKEKPNFSKLTRDEQKIYDLVVRRLLCVFFEDAKYLETTVTTDINKNTFLSKEKVLIFPGYKEVYSEKPNKSILSLLIEKSKSKNIKTTIIEDETKPRPRFNDATLLSAMLGAGKLIDDEELREAIKEKGIGTPATRAQIIERLIEVSYIVRDGKNLVPTGKGIYLIDLLSEIPMPELSSPELTGIWEKKFIEIEKGKLKDTVFMSDIEVFTKDIIEKVKNANFNKPTGDPIDKCPKCNNPIYESLKAYTCSNKSCSFKIWKKISNTNITKNIVNDLLKNKKTTEVMQFKSKEGKKFKAYLVIKDNFDVGMEFINSNEVVSNDKLGICPKCGNNVIEKREFYGCSSNECDFRISSTILGRKISKEEIINLLKNKKTEKLKGFWSKKRRPFSACLKINDRGLLEFDFS